MYVTSVVRSRPAVAGDLGGSRGRRLAGLVSAGKRVYHGRLPGHLVESEPPLFSAPFEVTRDAAGKFA
jgi:hypothetical protein